MSWQAARSHACLGPACRLSSSVRARRECWSTASRRSMRRGGRSPASPSWSTEPHLTDKHSLRLPAGGASLVHNLDEPLAAGRFDLAFLDDGAVVAGQQWSIELTFQGPSGLSAGARRRWAGRRRAWRSSRRAVPPGRPAAGSHAWLAPLLAPVRPRSDRDLRRRQGAGARQRARTARWSPSAWRARRPAQAARRPRRWQATSTTCN